MMSALLRSLRSAFKSRRGLALENLALRQQLAVLKQSVRRPRLSQALVHESELARNDPTPQVLHRPMPYDTGLPRAVI